MRMRVWIGLFTLAAATLACTAAQAQDAAVINKAVSQCLKVVHSSTDDEYAKYFDAFYNQASGLVENNVIYVSGRPALFQFNKCMAQHGVPLGAKTP